MDCPGSFSNPHYKRQRDLNGIVCFVCIFNTETVKTGGEASSAEDLPGLFFFCFFKSAETTGRKRREGGREGRGMICGHWAKKSHTSIHLCQDGRGEERGPRKGLDRRVWGANRAPNHILYLRLYLGYIYIYIE